VVLGVLKAYTTRVGSGPFPTELLDKVGEGLRTRGAEFGTTTGRPRRCGWFDAVGVRYAAEVSGLDSMALTKLDVLTGEPEIKICIAYLCEGVRYERFPADWETLAGAAPVYETMPGWSENIENARRLEQLPAAARNYVKRLELLSGVPIRYIGVGRGREAMIKL
jgi:adenylosuccinate synthase